MVFPKDFLKLILKSNQQKTKSMKNYPVGKGLGVKGGDMNGFHEGKGLGKAPLVNA